MIRRVLNMSSGTEHVTVLPDRTLCGQVVIDHPLGWITWGVKQATWSDNVRVCRKCQKLYQTIKENV